jgi:tetratricopeptide (TPR) repeat protein
MTEIMIKTATLCVLLLVSMPIAWAQTDNNTPAGSYIDSERRIGTIGLVFDGNGWVQGPEIDLKALREKTHSTSIKKMGWVGPSWCIPIRTRGPMDWADEATRQGDAAFRGGDLLTAETDFKRAIGLDETWPYAYIGLAKVFTAQGEVGGAIQSYRTVFYDLSLRNFATALPEEKEKRRQEVYKNPTSDQWASDGLRYALLLNRTEQWSEAVTVYNSALSSVPGGALPKLDISFDPSHPNPVLFEAASHIALGLLTNWGAGDDRNLRAMQEYEQALQLEPNWSLSNYYYGFGWQCLDPKDRAKMGSEQQAKAALQKAVKIGKGPVKQAAQRALLMAMKSK